MKTFLAKLYGSNNLLFLVLAILQILDTATGVFSAEKGHAFDKNKMQVGLATKVWDWVFVAVAFLIAHILVLLGGVLDVNLQLSRTLGWVVLASSLYKETRSVLSNLAKLGIALPGVLVRALSLAEKSIDGSLTLPTNGGQIGLQLDKSLEELQKSDVIKIKVNKSQ